MKPKRFKSLDRQRLSLSNILQRLPLHRQLNESQVALITLTPIWQTWAKAHLPSEFISQSQPSNFQNNELTISCHHAICASQLKHQQPNLLAFMQKSGMKEVLRIKIRLSHPSSTANHSAKPSNNNAEASTPRQTSDSSIKSIENCQQSIQNQKLANSLTQLVETLKEAEEEAEKDEKAHK